MAASPCLAGRSLSSVFGYIDYGKPEYSYRPHLQYDANSKYLGWTLAIVGQHLAISHIASIRIAQGEGIDLQPSLRGTRNRAGIRVIAIGMWRWSGKPR